MKSGEIYSWLGDQGGELGNEIQRLGALPGSALLMIATILSLIGPSP